VSTGSLSSGPPAEVPGWAARLGYAGLLPFVGGALLVWAAWPDVRPYAAQALSAYAATIVAFLGGIHWGIAFREADPPPRLFAWGVVPSLVAWAAVLMPPASGLVIHALMLVACYAVDRRVYPAHGLERWLVLRFRLSAGAAASCLLGAAGA
jgi:hypothetical protein